MSKLKKFTIGLICFVALISGVIFLPLFIGDRELSKTELSVAKEFFKDGIPYEKVRINMGGLLTWIYPGVTIGHIISFPNGSYDENNIKDQALLLHELTHIWQYEHIGWSYLPRSFYEEIAQADAYVVHYDASKAFYEYDLEEQAEIVSEYSLNGNEKFKPYIEALSK